MATKTKQKSATIPQILQWVPAKGGRRTYELRSADQTIARICWPKMLGSLADAEFGNDRWTFKRVGFLRPRVTIRIAGEADDSGVLELSCGGGGGLLRTKNGQSYHWNRQGFWSHRFVFMDDHGAELFRIEPKFGMLRPRGNVSVSPQASNVQELPLLMLLGWYVTMMMADDDAVTAIVCSG